MDASLFDVFITFGEGGKRLASYLGHNLSQLKFTNWVQKQIPVYAVNFSDDAMDVPVTSELIENMGGSGRQAEKAITYYKNNHNKIRQQIWDWLNISNSPKNIWIVSCLGGGVGTGSIGLGIQDVLDWARAYQSSVKPDYKPNIFLLLTLPKDSEGSKLKRNAFMYLNQLIAGPIKEGLVTGTILIDNETAEVLYGTSKGGAMWSTINNGIFNALSYVYSLPFRGDVDWTKGYKRLDYNDLMTSLSFGRGFIDIRRAVLSKDDFNNFSNPPEGYKFDIKTFSQLCSSQDINTTNRFAVIAGTPASWLREPELKPRVMDFTDLAIKEVVKKAKCSDYILANYTAEYLENLEITIVCSGMPLSQKVQQVLKTIVRDMVKDKNKKQVSELDLSVFNDL